MVALTSWWVVFKSVFQYRTQYKLPPPEQGLSQWNREMSALARGEKTLCSMGQLFISLLLQARSTIFFSWSRDWSVSTQRVQGLHTRYHLLKPISLSFPILHGKHEHTVCMKGNAQKQIQKTEKTPAKKLCCTHSFSQKRQEIRNMINIGSSTPW